MSAKKKNIKNEFTGIRSRLYKECLREFTDVRDEELNAFLENLNPNKDNIIVEVGAGSGALVERIANLIPDGQLIVSDPSSEQLEDLDKNHLSNVRIIDQGADSLNLKKNTADIICSLGALHHCFNKTKAFENFHRILKRGGRLVIADIFHGSRLAQHFDKQVARYCVTGHEVAFWTNEFTESLCFNTGFQKPKIHKLDVHWKFKTRKDIGVFLYKIHAMTKTTSEECLRGAEKILGINKRGNFYYLNWPLKLIQTKKL